jgi:hypothetical protein
MRRVFLSVAVAAFAAAPAVALKIAAPGNAGLQQKLIAADAVVVGQVTRIEADTLDVAQFPDGPKVPHTVAVIKVADALVGSKNSTHVKVVFPKPGAEPVQPGGGGPLRPIPAPLRGGFGPVAVAENQEGVFFLSKHPTAAGYYQIQPGHLPLNVNDDTYRGELAKVTAAAGAFADPVKALSADKVDDRVQAALALAYKYRAYPPNNTSGAIAEEPVPADVGTLLVKVLLDADWAKTDAHKLADALGLLPGQYGIPDVQPAAGENPLAVRQKAFKAWHAKFGGKFEVKKVVAKPQGK